MTISQQFAELGVALRWESLPPEVQHRARLCLLDMLGATIAGVATHTAKQGAAVARRHGWSDAAQLIGQNQRASSPFAALANGMNCHALEVDDGHRYAIGLHNAATTIPAALAVAEEENASIEQLLAALVLGYEVAGRIGTAMNPAHRHAGFHSTGTIGVFGATAAAAHLRGLNAEKFARALGIAGSASAGIFEFLSDGSTSKHFHGGHAAMAGIVAADLAAEGLTGPISIFEGQEGIFKAYSPHVNQEGITKGLGERYEVMNVFFKIHATCAHVFPPIDAILELRGRIGTPLDFERMVVHTYHSAAILNKQRPPSRAGAKFSIPYCAAIAWVHGRATDELFDEEYLADPAILALAERVEVVEDPALEADFPNTRAARVEVAVRGGSRRETYVPLPKGMPEYPASEDELVAKFRGLVAPILGVAATERLQTTALRGDGVSARALAEMTVKNSPHSATR